jgi:hypothetical protein
VERFKLDGTWSAWRNNSISTACQNQYDYNSLDGNDLTVLNSLCTHKFGGHRVIQVCSFISSVDEHFV